MAGGRVDCRGGEAEGQMFDARVERACAALGVWNTLFLHPTT